MFGIGFLLGGGVFYLAGHKLKESSARVLGDTTVIAGSQDISMLPATPAHERDSAYVSFSGRLKGFDSPLLQSAISRRTNSTALDAIRIHSKTFHRYDEIVTIEQKVSESEVGGAVAVEPFTATSTTVVVKNDRFIQSLYKAGDDEFTPAVDSNMTIFGDAPRSKTIGFRTVERLIPVDGAVSGVGFVEGRLVAGATGAPKLTWVLVPTDDGKSRARPAFLVYGDKDDLIREQQRKAAEFNTDGSVLKALGVAMVLIGGFSVARTKRRSLANLAMKNSI
ncbi:Aste57867_11789 [Aphanomyces stellatus]|uniref:Aste57867_11789 protein n=1 Tax=Aphanomyces stellatus TaxID=120398 RepID=A0A485KUB7_9STRA|nr:hypothetical protein As57867_011744 [Aphanomyces stellatus]VFT88645.1 Aste57867_11789 [Aphanomyces stellatus]